MRKSGTGLPAGIAGTRTLLDARGTAICKIDRKASLLSSGRTYVLPPNTPVEAREAAPVQITRMKGSGSFSVFRFEMAISGARGGTAQVLHFAGDHNLRRGVVLQGSEESGRVVARLSRGESHFASHEIVLEVAPGLDSALAIVLAMMWSRAVREEQSAAGAGAGAVAAGV